ncbi:MAG TPA: hypothetical protein VGK99_21680 [Acidobacteriota bacterium]|jgi:hypothetical protein
MKKIKDIEKEIRKLSRSELTSFREWFVEYDADAWDQQIEEDVAAGKLDDLASEAVAAYKRGESTKI